MDGTWLIRKSTSLNKLRQYGCVYFSDMVTDRWMKRIIPLLMDKKLSWNFYSIIEEEITQF